MKHHLCLEDGTLVKILLGETLGPVGRLPGETLLEMLSYADYVQVNCFVTIQLAKDKSMIAVTGVERFHWSCDVGNTYEGNALELS